jgi:hypothetical protein
MNQAVLHLRDSPREQIPEWARFLKIETGEFAPEADRVKRGCDRPLDNAFVGTGQLPR